MSDQRTEQGKPSVPAGSQIRCKPKHRALKSSTEGTVRASGDLRSVCPGWASGDVQQRLLSEALVDRAAGEDSHGRPRRLWNAVNGTVFVGVSTNEPVPAYNCYPEVPATALAGSLETRARRSLGEVMEGGSPNDAP